VARDQQQGAGGSPAGRRVDDVASTLHPEDLPPAQQRRRARIVRAALRMLEKDEYADIQIRDVGDRADVALGTVYRYFVSKERLFAAVLVEWGEAMHERMQVQPLTGETAQERLNELVDRAFDAFERRPHVYRVVIALEDTTDPHTRALLQDFGGRIQQAFLESLESLEPQDAEAIVNITTALLSDALRRVATGALTMRQARARAARSLEVVFAPPPQPRRLPEASTVAVDQQALAAGTG
jgi:AcrR family transcriptional regulator